MSRDIFLLCLFTLVTLAEEAKCRATGCVSYRTWRSIPLSDAIMLLVPSGPQIMCNVTLRCCKTMRKRNVACVRSAGKTEPSSPVERHGNAMGSAKLDVNSSMTSQSALSLSLCVCLCVCACVRARARCVF
jgi:hypothetical protein